MGPTTPVVVRSAEGESIVVIDIESGKIVGGDEDQLNDLNVLIFPAQNVARGLQGLRDSVNALANAPKVVFSDKATGQQRCKNNRKSGWTIAIAVAVGAALAVPTGGSSAVAVAGFLAAGAAGGAGAAMTDNAYQECMEGVEEKEKEKEKEKGK